MRVGRQLTAVLDQCTSLSKPGTDRAKRRRSGLWGLGKGGLARDTARGTHVVDKTMETGWGRPHGQGGA